MECEFSNMNLSQIRDAMQRYSNEQECFIQILCDVLDECIVFNDSLQVNISLPLAVSIIRPY